MNREREREREKKKKKALLYGKGVSEIWESLFTILPSFYSAFVYRL